MGANWVCLDSQLSATYDMAQIESSKKFTYIKTNDMQGAENMTQDLAFQARLKALSELKYQKQLKLKVINSDNMPKGTTFLISPQGLENSPRGAKDGYVFFGDTLAMNYDYVNDIAVPSYESEDEEKCVRKFMVYFHLNKQVFMLRDLGRNEGAFVKMVNTTAIQNNSFINIGEQYLGFNIEAVESSPRLMIIEYNKKEIKIIKSFESSDHINQHLYIGRKKTCEISIEDSSLSKIQCSIFYDLSSGWNISDGDLKTSKKSMNGTWLYINNEMEIYNKMILKFNQTLIKAAIQ